MSEVRFYARQVIHESINREIRHYEYELCKARSKHTSPSVIECLIDTLNRLRRDKEQYESPISS